MHVCMYVCVNVIIIPSVYFICMCVYLSRHVYIVCVHLCLIFLQYDNYYDNNAGHAEVAGNTPG